MRVSMARMMVWLTGWSSTTSTLIGCSRVALFVQGVGAVGAAWGVATAAISSGFWRWCKRVHRARTASRLGGVSSRQSGAMGHSAGGKKTCCDRASTT